MLKLKNECQCWIKGVLNLKNEGCMKKRLINWILIGKTRHTGTVVRNLQYSKLFIYMVCYGSDIKWLMVVHGLHNLKTVCCSLLSGCPSKSTWRSTLSLSLPANFTGIWHLYTVCSNNPELLHICPVSNEICLHSGNSVSLPREQDHSLFSI